MREPEELLSELVKRFRTIDTERAELLAKLRRMKQIADEALAPQPDPEVVRPLAEVEREHIVRVLEELGGNRARAAAILGIAISTLNAKLARYRSEEKAPGAAGQELEGSS